MNELIFQIEQARSHQERLELLNRLEAYLQQNPAAKAQRHLKSLLYHPDWYIRQEIAFLIDRYGIPLKPEEQWQYWYALQQFDVLKNEMATDEAVRELLFRGCLDAAPRFRARVSQHLRPADCRTLKESLLRLYALGDYAALVEQGCEGPARETVLELLQFGLQAENNPEYHRKQCAFALEQLQALENAAGVVQEILAEKTADAEAPQSPSAADEIALLPLSPLEQFLRRLQQQGIRVDGKTAFPQIHQTPATGRITYQNPGLQTWAKSERLRRLTPEPGFVWLRCDYRTIEPALMLHFLLQRFLISLEDVPEGDIYAAVNPQDRSAAKKWLNAVINGGGKTFWQNLNPWQIMLLDALQELRRELLQMVYTEGGITTIGGHFRKLDRQEKNLAGKAVNRLVQGSASDIFNHAVVEIDRALREKALPARVGFLLFDEVWIELQKDATETVVPLVLQILLSVNAHFQLLCPLGVRHVLSEAST